MDYPNPDSPPPYFRGFKRKILWLLLFLTPVVLSAIIYRFSFSVAEVRRIRRLPAAERIGEGLLRRPGDLAYDGEPGYLYVECSDGWIRRVKLIGSNDHDEPKVEDWVRLNSDPIGIAFAPDRSLVVADFYEGLLKVKLDKTVEILKDEDVEGLLTDDDGDDDEDVFDEPIMGVDVASDGVIYLIDSSIGGDLATAILEILLAKPQGRLMSFDPSTNRTVVLARDLYFASALSLSSDQDSLIFCEILLRRCRTYHIRGEKRGTIDIFIDYLPGFPDSIRYDKEDHYWIGFSGGRRLYWDIQNKFSSIEKILFIPKRFITLFGFLGNSEGLLVTLEGEPHTLYTARDLLNGTSWLKIGKYLYYSSLHKDYIGKIDLTHFSEKRIDFTPYVAQHK